MNRKLAILMFWLASVAVTPSAQAEEAIMLTGRVFRLDGKTPVPNATVVVYDDKNRVTDYAKTDESGYYTLTVPRSALHLDKKDGGFFHKVGSAVGGVGRVAVMPLKYGVKAAAAAASAADPVTKIGVGTASGLAQGLLDGMSPRGKKGTTERQNPGVMVIKAVGNGQADVVSLARVYWVEEQISVIGGKNTRTLWSWIDPVHLASSDSDKPSTVESKFLTFTNVRIEPSVAELGQTVKLIAKLDTPPEPQTPVVVVAHNARTNEFFEMTRMSAGIYEADVTIDKKWPKHDQTITMLAYAEQDDKPGRSKNVENSLRGAGLFDPSKPFLYNPLLVASRNRGEVVLTVVEPAKKKR